MDVDGHPDPTQPGDEEEDTPEKLRAERWQAVQQREGYLRKITEAIKALEESTDVDPELTRLLERNTLNAEAFLLQATEHYRELRPQSKQLELAKKDLLQTKSKLDRTKGGLEEVQAQLDKLVSRKELLLGQQQAQQAKQAKLEGRIADLEAAVAEDKAKQDALDQATAKDSSARVAEVVEVEEFQKATARGQRGKGPMCHTVGGSAGTPPTATGSK
jgi:hypothetical protein